MCGSDAGIGREWCNGVFPEEEASIAVVRSWSIAVVATKEWFVEAPGSGRVVPFTGSVGRLGPAAEVVEEGKQQVLGGQDLEGSPPQIPVRV